MGETPVGLERSKLIPTKFHWCFSLRPEKRNLCGPRYSAPDDCAVMLQQGSCRLHHFLPASRRRGGDDPSLPQMGILWC